MTKDNNECWVTNGYGCPFQIGEKLYDSYKCSFRNKNSPCMKKGD